MDPRIDDPHQPHRERTPEDDLIETVADDDVEHAYRVNPKNLSERKVRMLKLALAWRHEEDEVVADVDADEFRDVYGVDRSDLAMGRAHALALALRGQAPAPPVRPPGVPLDAVYGADRVWRLADVAYDETGRRIEGRPPKS